MNGVSQKVWTYELNGADILIDESFGFIVLSLVLVSGSGYFRGSGLANGLPSQNVQLVAGQPVTISSSSSSTVLDDFYINATTGVVSLLGKF